MFGCVVIDLETTGFDPGLSEITEMAAVRLSGARRVGHWHTLVKPEATIPLQVTEVTGITQRMVMAAPPIDRVLASFLAFVGDSVIVGHNVAFDIAFLDAALGVPVTNATIDTCELARRLVGDEIPDRRLSTVAAHLGAPHRPTHRALADALATVDVLLALMKRGGIELLDRAS